MSDKKKVSTTLDYVAPKARHAWWKYASNSSSHFAFNIIGTPMSVFLYLYYEVVLGLNGTLIFLAMSIYMIYNAIDDPLLSFLMDRNTRLTKRWGRHFPWIVIGIIPWCVCFYFIFLAPDIDGTTNPWPLFWYLILMLCLYDTSLVFYGINVSALRPDLFRTEEERRKLVPWWMVLDVASMIISMVIGPFLIGSGFTRAGFAFMAAVFGITSFIASIFSLPGNWEDKVVKERYFIIPENRERMNFFTCLKNAIKTRSVVIYLLLYASWTIASSLVLENSLYINTYILRGSPNTMLMLIFLIAGALISIPFWLRFLKGKGNKKVLSLGGFLLVAALVPISFATSFPALIIMMLILGLVSGGYWVLIYTTIQAIIFDDFAVKTKVNQKAIIIGIIGFIGTFFTTIDEGIIALVHNLTGFIPGQATYEDMLAAVTAAGGDINLVLLGVSLLAGVIPAIFMLVGVLVFWKYFPLTKEKVLENKAKLKELGL